jgi:hypothetical protein
VASLTGSLTLILGLFLGYLLSSRLARYGTLPGSINPPPRVEIV